MTDTIVGYTGGVHIDPTYRSIGDHFEGLLVQFDPAVVSYEELLAKFFAEHSASTVPSTRKNQYNNGCWYCNDAQRDALAAVVQSTFTDPSTQCRTPIGPMLPFYRAEEYHQHYFARRGGGGSCGSKKKSANLFSFGR